MPNIWWLRLKLSYKKSKKSFRGLIGVQKTIEFHLLTMKFHNCHQARQHSVLCTGSDGHSLGTSLLIRVAHIDEFLGVLAPFSTFQNLYLNYNSIMTKMVMYMHWVLQQLWQLEVGKYRGTYRCTLIQQHYYWQFTVSKSWSLIFHVFCY